MDKDKVVIIGGSGIHDSPAFEGLEWKVFDTEFVRGDGDGIVYYQENGGVIFIPRHGVDFRPGKGVDPKKAPNYFRQDRRFAPSRTQYAANMIAAKVLGCGDPVVIASSAVGSLKPDEICVESLVVPDDYVDESGRDDNLFGVGLVVHGNPRPAFDKGLRQILYEEGKADPDCFKGVHDKATYVCIQGDRFGTTAEGAKRRAYADIVGMTSCPEASMAIQLELRYAIAAFPVDVDDNANHEGGTLEVMHRLSLPGRVPAFISRVIERAKDYATMHFLSDPRLKGNLIPGDTRRITNKYLRQIADEMKKKYCR